MGLNVVAQSSRTLSLNRLNANRSLALSSLSLMRWRRLWTFISLSVCCIGTLITYPISYIFLWEGSSTVSALVTSYFFTTSHGSETKLMCFLCPTLWTLCTFIVFSGHNIKLCVCDIKGFRKIAFKIINIKLRGEVTQVVFRSPRRGLRKRVIYLLTL